MKFKLLALAAMMAASGAANAAIDTGTDGFGDFYFSLWDGNSAYHIDLNLQQDAFTAGVNADGAYNFSLNLASDTLFQQFISTANVAALSWNLIATESQGARTVHQTYSTPLPATGITAGNARSMVGSMQTFAQEVSGLAGASDSVVIPASSGSFIGNRLGCTNFTFQSFNSCGSVANNSFATGLGLVVQTFAASGTAASVLTPVVDGGNAVRAYLAPGYNLQIAAVPEPETYAMLLAGLGLMGAIARRRRQNQA